MLALAVSVLVILQLPGVLGFAENYDESIVISVAVYHFICIVLVFFEAKIEALQGKKPLYSQFVVCTGLVATLLQSSLLRGSDGQGFAYALAVLTLQSLANGFMFSKIVSESLGGYGVVL